MALVRSEHASCIARVRNARARARSEHASHIVRTSSAAAPAEKGGTPQVKPEPWRLATENRMAPLRGHGCAEAARNRARTTCAPAPAQLHTPIRTHDTRTLPFERMSAHTRRPPQLARKSRLRTPSTHGLRARSGELACARLLPTGCARTLAHHPAHATARAQPLCRMPARTHAAHALREPPAALNCELLSPALPSSSCRFPASSQIKTKHAPRLDPLNHRGAVGLRRACKSSGDKRMSPRRAAKDVFGHIEPGFSGLGARPQRWPSSRNPVLRSMRLSAQTPGAGNEPSTAARVSAPIPHMRHSRVLSRRHSLSPDSLCGKGHFKASSSLPF